jgi:hypothetical protein
VVKAIVSTTFGIKKEKLSSMSTCSRHMYIEVILENVFVLDCVYQCNPSM